MFWGADLGGKRTITVYDFPFSDPLQTWLTNRTSEKSDPLIKLNLRRPKLKRKTRCQPKKVRAA